MKSHPNPGFGPRPPALAAPSNRFRAIKALCCSPRAAVCLTLTLLATIPLRTLAQLPTGAQVVSGAASFSTAPGALTITQTTDRAIINWQDFSLAAGATTRFVQPDATSATLNRVVSGLPSTLAGSLQANGHIYLINPNGILIGAGARIDTAGFLASTLDVSNHDFLAGGDLHFGGDSTAAIMNLGSINALGGDVFLIARQVENAGAITANRGTVGLAAGSEILLTTGGNERQFVRAASLPGTLVNAGTISAASAELKAAGGNAFALAINNSGTVRATGSAVRAGQIWLVANGGEVASSGTLAATTADGARGGDVRLLGAKVTLAAGALVDVSGALGGGTALIGGDYQGKNPAVPNARTTTVASGAVLRADAVTSGNGGKIVVWSDDTTQFAGQISARGGATGGDGGFAEVSGKNVLAYGGFADLRATTGATGTLLLDPTNITISGAGSDLNPTFGSFTGGVFDGGANINSTISIGSGAGDTNNTLLKQLSGANVVISTTSTGAGTGTIAVNGGISYNSANSLTLTAASTLTINSPITNTGAGALTLNADNGITINANVTTAGVTTLNADKNNDGTGTLTVANNITVATGGAALNVTAADIALVFFGNLNSGASPTTITASAGRSIGLGATAGDLWLTDTELARVNASSVILNTTGLTGDVTVNGITFAGSSKPVTINAGGTVTFATGASTFSKGLTVNANDGIVVGADITASNGNIVLDGDADSTASPGDGIAFTGTRTLTTGIDFVVPYNPAQGSITLRNGASGANGNITSAALNLRAADNITISDDLTATGGTFSAIANNPGGADYLNSVTGRFTLASGKTLATATSGNIDLMASKVTLDGNLNSVGTVSITGSRNTPVNLGSPETQVVEPALLVLSDAALGRITATGLTIGVETTGLAAIYMKNLTAANTDQFGPLTLTTPGFVGFEGTSVVGNRLTASGLGGIVFYALANLSTSTAVTGDPDLTLSGNNIMFNSSVTVTAGGTGTLSLNPTDTFVSNGNLTLESGDHLEITRALTSYGTFTFNADKNNDGVGTFTVPTGIAVTTTAQFGAQSINITAADIALVGSATLNSNAGPTKITASAGRSAGLGATVVAGGLNLDGAEFEKITATGFTLTSAGNITVDGISEPNSNKISAITTLTANGVSSAVTFANNASTFNTLTVNSTTTIANNAVLTLDTGNLVLNAGSTITQTGAIEIAAHTATLTGTTITLTNASNTLGAITVTSGAGDVSIREDEAISIAAITRTSGNLTLNAAGDITQTGAIAIAAGTANLTASNITLNTATNVLGAVTVNAGTGNVALTENDAITVAAITHTGTLNLTAAGAITSSGTVVVSGTTTLAAGAANDITLANANDFSTVIVTSGKNVTLNDLNALAFGNVTAAGSLLATAGGDLTLNGGATIAATGAVANPLVLVAGANFINNSGAAALNPGTGRWLVYSTSPAGSTENGLTAAAGSTLPRLYNKTFAGNAPATIAAGNHLIYSAQPTLTVTAADAARAYGAANPTFTATTAGFLTDDGVTDTATTAGLTGTAGLTSLANATSPVSGSPFTITVDTSPLASAAGYAFTAANGLLTINKANLLLSGTRVYDGTTIFAGGFLTATGVNGETFAVTGTGATGNLTTKNVQSGQPLVNLTSLALGASGNGGISSNYNNLTVTGSTVSVTPATLTLSGTRAYDGTTLFAGANLTAAGVNGETFAITGTGLTGNLTTKNVQTNQLLASVGGLTLGTSTNGGAAGNYSALSTTGSSVSVTRANLSVTTGNVVKTYDGTTSATGSPVILSGQLFGSDALSSGSFGPNYAFVGKDVGIGNKTVTLSGIGVNDGNNGANYSLTLVNNTTSTINPAPLTLTAISTSRSYGAANPAFTATYAGLVNGETSAVVTGLQIVTPATTASNVGSYAITPSAATAPNYALTFLPGTLTINPAALTLTAIGTSRIYGAANPAFDATYTGLVNGDTSAVVTGLQLTTPATVTSNVGNYAVTPSGAAASNYTITQVPGTLTINPKDIVVTAAGGTSVYGASPTNPGFTATGLVNSQTASVLTGLAGNFAVTNNTNVSSNTLSVTGTLTNGNYNITTRNDGTWTVTPKDVIVTATGGTSLYGASPTNPGFTATGLVNSQTASVLTGLANNFAITNNTNVSSNTLSVTGTLTNGNYNIATRNDGTWVVSPRNLVVTANNGTKVYGQTKTFAGTEFTSTGLQNSQTIGTVTLASAGTVATAGVASSPYSLVASAAAGGTFNPANYSLSYVAGSLAVTPAALTITASNATKIYGQTTTFTGTEFTSGGLQNSETIGSVTLTSAGTVPTAGVGSSPYSLVASAATGGTFSGTNYVIGYLPGALTITPAVLTYVATSANRLIGVANPAFSGTVTGFVNSETLASATTGSLSFGTTATITSPVGVYSINGSGLTANNGNYSFIQAPPNATAFTINSLSPTTTPLTITADNKTKLYGAPLPTFTASFAGFINSDTASSVTGLQFNTTATIGSNVGTFTITPFGATAPSYYTVGYVPGILTINPASLSITANNAARVYAAANPAFTASFAGFVNGDTSALVSGLQITTPATTTSNVGSYAITPAGAIAPNYALTFLPGTLTINPASLSITANSAARIYGAANPAFTASYAGFVNGDTSSVVSGLQLTTPATVTSNVGNYAITPSAATASNYALSFLPGTLTINRASLTLTAANATRDFGAPNPVFTGAFNGFVNGDTAAVVSGLAFTTPATATSPAGAYPIVPSGATAANYALAFVNGTLGVTAPTLVVGGTPLPVTTVNQLPAITSDLAVIKVGDRLSLIPITGGDASGSLDGKLTVTLAQVTNVPGFDLTTTESSGRTNVVLSAPGRPNFGGFELIPTLSGGGAGGGTGGDAGKFSASQLSEPGLYRESSVSMGGFNVIYHEPVAEARQQAASNTALGSSYREFSEEDHPQLNIVRAKTDKKPAGSAAGNGAGGAQ